MAEVVQFQSKGEREKQVNADIDAELLDRERARLLGKIATVTLMGLDDDRDLSYVETGGDW